MQVGLCRWVVKMFLSKHIIRVFHCFDCSRDYTDHYHIYGMQTQVKDIRCIIFEEVSNELYFVHTLLQL